MNLRLLVVSGVAVLVAAGLGLACRDNPSIDGASVPRVGSASAPPTCEQVCERLAQLCGYAPVSCVERCTEEADEGGRVCRGEASSCREALTDCVPAPADAGGEDGDAGEAEADADAPASDADAGAGDAAADAGDGG